MSLVEAVKFIELFGPYAIVVFIGFAYWRKDRQNTELMQKMSKIIEEKTAADTKLEVALSGLRDVIMVLTNKLS